MKGVSPMASSEMMPNFQRGVMTIVLLALLKKEDMYGYQLVQETERCSGGALITQEGSLYPVLYKLLDHGFISDRRVKVGKRMTRVYYHLEPAGATHLDEMVREYESITGGVMRIVRGEESEACEQQKTVSTVLQEGLEAAPVQLEEKVQDLAEAAQQSTTLAEGKPAGGLC